MEKTFLIIVGEKSADNHGAKLIESIKMLEPKSSFIGLGGPNMVREGLYTIEDIEKLAIMGFSEVIKQLLFFLRLRKKIIKIIKNYKPDHIILIDYPGFNLRLLKKIKKNFNIPITYYISPQIWAWKENRIRLIKKYVDQMLVIFKFEKRWYKERGLNVKYVGHPFFDQWEPTHKKIMQNLLKISKDKLLVTLYPGSRKQELKRHLPLFIEIAKKIKEKIPETHFIIGLANNLEISSFIIPSWIKIERENSQISLECADLALVCSGTATFEAAVYKTPMIIIYKMSKLSWLITKLIVRVKFAGIINIIANNKIIPEYIQYEAQVDPIVKNSLDLLKNEQMNKEMKKNLKNICKDFNTKGASINVAKKIINYKNENKN